MVPDDSPVLTVYRTPVLDDASRTAPIVHRRLSATGQTLPDWSILRRT
jgi:hypothetical protein